MISEIRLDSSAGVLQGPHSLAIPFRDPEPSRYTHPWRTDPGLDMATFPPNSARFPLDVHERLLLPLLKTGL